MPNDRLVLEVTLPAYTWDAHKRRLAFLEAALVQMMGEDQQLRLWFSAAALSSMRLPGMPASRNGIVQKAEREGWPRRIVSGRGGERYEFHYAGLPRPAFDEIIRRVLELPAERPEPRALLPVETPSPSADIAPQWLLPLMRVVKTGASIEVVMRELPALLPKGSPLPTMAEVSAVLKAHGGKR